MPAHLLYLLLLFLSVFVVLVFALTQPMLHFSTALSEIVRTNETCQRYSEACIKLCNDLEVKAIDLWTAIQKQDDWANICFT